MVASSVLWCCRIKPSSNTTCDRHWFYPEVHISLKKILWSPPSSITQRLTQQSTAGIFTFQDVNTLCVWRVFVWVIGRSEEPSFWFLHPRPTLTCGLHSGIVFHWNVEGKVKGHGCSWGNVRAQGRWWRLPAVSFFVAPHNPSMRRLATTVVNRWKQLSY